MDTEELVGKALFCTKEAASVVLKKTGWIFPLGVILDRSGEDVRTFYPRDSSPSADFSELLDLVVDELRAAVQSGEAHAVALATTLESGDATAMGVQVETAETAILLVYPYRKSLFGWKFEEPDSGDDLLVYRIYDRKTAAD
jgi:hypothetical protein